MVENLIKNAVDAMQGVGRIDIYTGVEKNRIYIDFKDTGKGIARKNFKNVFNPGYIHKKTGMGLRSDTCKKNN